MKREEIQHATLDELTDELAAAGWDSTQTDLREARIAVENLIAEHKDTQPRHRNGSLVKTHETNQTAYVGRFAIETDTGLLLHGGGVIAPRPRLYETAAAATQAVAAINPTDWQARALTPVLLVADKKGKTK